MEPDTILAGEQGYFLLPGGLVTRLAPATVIICRGAFHISRQCRDGGLRTSPWSVVFNARQKECLLLLLEPKIIALTHGARMWQTIVMIMDVSLSACEATEMDLSFPKLSR